MYAGFLPTWRQDFHSGRIAGEAECEASGRFLGERFCHQNDPIIWFMGADLPTGAFPLSRHRALARGIAKGVSGGVEDNDAVFCSYHVAGRGNTPAFPPYEPFMDFDTIQSGHWNTKPYELPSEGVIAESLAAHNKPCSDFEPMYESIRDYASAATVRHIIGETRPKGRLAHPVDMGVCGTSARTIMSAMVGSGSIPTTTDLPWLNRLGC